MDSRRPRPSTGPSSNGGGKFLQGVWMSKCEGGRIERLTKWSDGQKDQKLGSLDKLEHSSMVKMNLMQLEVRDELAALKKSRRVSIAGQKSESRDSESPKSERGKIHRGSLSKDLHPRGSAHDKVKSPERNSKFKHFGEHGSVSSDSGKISERNSKLMQVGNQHVLEGNSKVDHGRLRLKPLASVQKVQKERSDSGKAMNDMHSVSGKVTSHRGDDSARKDNTDSERVKPTRKMGRVELNGDVLHVIGDE